ncbi:hypothetical protein PIB30_006083 [Stylosanthes scabra]|uniref:RNase H type-1 domain-containing protein n=1 Tax=Stylosanthes scabra TaxID=79078 RepID=A0ABU6V624_9FABA|nr:hypothetical protein [Stylosanthes scabra]
MRRTDNFLWDLNHNGQYTVRSGYNILKKLWTTKQSFKASTSGQEQGLWKKNNLQVEKILFESDCMKLIQAIKSQDHIAEIEAYLEDIGELKKELPESGFLWVPRESNLFAHEAARLAAIGELNPS